MARPLKEDLTGRVFGRLTVTGRDAPYWRCICTCGATKSVLGGSLTSGATKSCGCLRKEYSALTKTTHGKAANKHSRVYRIWNGMKNRCHNEKQPHYVRYGGRGIKVCEEWRKSFATFYAYMGDPPTDRHSLDRLDNNGDYQPGNVRWATSKEQRANRRDS